MSLATGRRLALSRDRPNSRGGTLHADDGKLEKIAAHEKPELYAPCGESETSKNPMGVMGGAESQPRDTLSQTEHVQT